MRLSLAPSSIEVPKKSQLKTTFRHSNQFKTSGFFLFNDPFVYFLKNLFVLNGVNTAFFKDPFHDLDPGLSALQLENVVGPQYLQTNDEK